MSAPLRLTDPIAAAEPTPATGDASTSPGGLASADRRAFQFDNIVEGLQSGRFGGVKLSGSVPAALVALLDRLDWEPSVRAFAGAMPHIPDRFDAAKIAAVFERLGFAAKRRRVRGRDLAALNGRALAMLPAARARLIERDEFGAVELEDPVTGERLPVGLGTIYDVVEVTRAEAAPLGPRDSWVASVGRRFTNEIWFLAGLIFLSNTLVVASSLWIMAVFDKAIPAQALNTLAMFAVGLVGLLVVDLFLRRLRMRLVARISGRLEYLLGTAMFSKLMAFPTAMITAAPISNQISRLKQFETVRDFFGSTVVAILLEIPFLIFLIGVIALFSPALAGIALAFLIGFAALVGLVFPQITRASGALSRHRGEHQRLILETRARRDQIAAMGLSETWSARVAKATARAVDARLEMERYNRLLSVITTAAPPLSGGVILLWGAAMVIQGDLSGGQLVAVTILVWRFLAPVQHAILAAMRLPETLGLFRQIDAVMRLDSGPRPENATLIRHLDPSIAVENLVVRYAGAASASVAGVSLQIGAGELIVVSGASGSGKTTLLRAIAGQYAAQSGSVRIGGTNIQQIAAADLTDQVGYVSKQNLVFHGTVAQNLFLAAPAARPADLRAVAGELGILKDILALPDGFDTRLNHLAQTEISSSLRIMIAASQVLLRAPKVIVMDEPSSPLGQSYQDHLSAALERRRGEVTVVIASEDTCVQARADQHIVMAAGRIQDIRKKRSEA
ncbi:MAG: ABC transporter transmembrane domain-containing protein [Pseudomonadota bacterium]